MLYFAYGSNLCRQQMMARCPDHREVGQGIIRGWRWIITTRGYASIVPSEPDYVLGTVYELSDADVENLDIYEGVAKGSYFKEMVTVVVDGKELSCLVYIDLVTEEGKPKEEYIARINHGIMDAGFADEYVEKYLRSYIPDTM